jgi:hypothetical protein
MLRFGKEGPKNDDIADISMIEAGNICVSGVL